MIAQGRMDGPEREVIMGSYWAGYHGQGLVLTAGEFQSFLRSYADGCTDEGTKQEIEDFLDDEISIDDITFKSASGKPFTMFDVDNGFGSGFTLTPYREHGKPNRDWEPDRHILNGWDDDGTVYVCGADMRIDGMDCFDRKAYGSYEEFVDEFKDKLAVHLPEGFDWESHIGIYQYAAYA